MDKESHSTSETEKLSSATLKIQVISQVESRGSLKKPEPKVKPNLKAKPGYGFWDKFKVVLSSIDVEPVFFLYNAVFQISVIIVVDFLYYQSCTVNQQMSEEYCTRNKTKDDLVAENVADIKIWQEVIDNVCTVTLCLFIGAWGDLYGRKLPILIVLSGNIIQAAVLLVIHLGFGQVTSVEVTAILAILPVALTGQIQVMAMAVYSYSASSSSVRLRTLKVGGLTTASYLGRSTGSALVGVLKEKGHGYSLIFGLIGGLQLVSFAYTLLVLKSSPGQDQGQNGGQCQRSMSNEAKSGPRIFSLRHVAETCKCFVKRREGRIRLHVVLLAAVIALSNISNSGERAVIQQFTFKQLKWTTSDFAFFSTFQQLFAALGGISILALLTQILKLGDSSLGILAAISQICATFFYAFADRTWMMYLAPVLGILDKTVATASRSMLSKTVPKHEFGKLLSFASILMSFARLAMDPIYAFVFRWTLNSFPGTFFFISTTVALPILVIYIYFHCHMKTNERRKERQIERQRGRQGDFANGER